MEGMKLTISELTFSEMELTLKMIYLNSDFSHSKWTYEQD